MSLVDVYHPNPEFSGTVVGGAVFVDGHARVQGMALRYFERHQSQGYQIGVRHEDVSEPVEEPEVVVEEHTSDDEDDVPGRPRVNDSRGTWADHAESMGIDTEGLTKDQIRDAVKAADTK